MRILITSLLFFVSPLYAAEPFKEDMETDRPDFTEGTKTVEEGRVQVELGYLFTEFEEGDLEIEDHSFPETLLRYGLNEELELRLTWGGYSSTEVEQAGASRDFDGATDMGIGLKHRIVDTDDFSFSILADLSLPVGANNKTSDNVEPNFSFLFSKDLPGDFSLASNLNLSFVTGDDDETVFDPSASLALGYEVCENLGSYLEYFGFYPTEDDKGLNEEHYLAGGLLYALNEDMQLDALVGFGLNDDSADLFAGVGFSFRL